MPQITKVGLILGGRRSGKSAFSEKLADAFVQNRTYIATAQGFDAEFNARIQAHQQSRATDWQLIEAPIDLINSLRRADKTDHFILIDCLTLWLTNLLLAEHDIENALDQLIAQLGEMKGHVAIVSNEVGLSITPDNQLARQFADVNGTANQRLAEIASDVFFITAGLPLRLKG